MRFPRPPLLVLLAALGTGLPLGTPPATSAETGSSPGRRPDPDATALVRDILSRVPDRRLLMTGVLKLRDAEGHRSEVPVRYTVAPEPGGWRGTYETKAAAGRVPERLVIIRRQDEPTRYLHTVNAGPEGPGHEPAELVGEHAAIPFAGTDYWLSDLGLEFLHWPDQRMVRDARITMRQSRPCKVLDSFSPEPARTKYARVRSWLDAESGAPIYAEGFDEKGRRFKVFSLRGFTKVNGHWQPKDLEMLNEFTDSRTRLELTLDSD